MTTLCLVTNGITFGDIMLFFFIGIAILCLIAFLVVGAINLLRTIQKPTLDTASQRRVAELEEAVKAMSATASQEAIANKVN